MTELLYLEDPYRRACSARAVAVERGAEGYRAELTATVLYPEGGGQPADWGTIGGVAVRDVRKSEDGRVLHLLDAAPPEGEVEVVLDWSRRYDHMQQHTAQHLLTALADALFGWGTTAFHLGPQDADIDLDVREASADELARLEDEANARIREARAVAAMWVDRGDLERLGVRSRGLPDDLGERVRLVEIEGVDRNTCGGTHVASTAELQSIQLLGTERAHGHTRLRWIAGGRVRRRFAAALGREARLTELTSRPPEEHVAAVERALGEAAAVQRTCRALGEELAELIGNRLAATDAPAAGLVRQGADLAFLNAVASVAAERRPEGLFLLVGESSDREGVFLLVGPAEDVKRAGPRVAEILEGRGGGARGRFQGKASRPGRFDEALRAVESVAEVGDGSVDA